ncbi:MAG: hypothetical protein QM741_13320 [Rudaea sp.]|uniref:hypothetical protein n=1 Tax=Rudaea sp. TaxID=2136325 RepID=UPI0039E233F6
MFNRLVVLTTCALLCVPGSALARRKANDAAIEARFKALEQRVAELEAKLAARPVQARP